jgi:Zn-dependent M16 (insulinase) family peptidase
MAELDEAIRMYTGGISVSPIVSPNHSDLDRVQQGLAFSASCLDRNESRLFELLEEIMLQPNFEAESQLKTLILGVRPLVNGFR